jgi:hypothetical protein
MGGGVPRLLEQALRNPRTSLTTTNSTSDTEGGPPGTVGAGATPGTPGAPLSPPLQNKPGIRLKTGSSTISNQTSGHLNDRG